MVKPTQPIPHGRGVSGVNPWPGQPRRATPRRSRGYHRFILLVLILLGHDRWGMCMASPLLLLPLAVTSPAPLRPAKKWLEDADNVRGLRASAGDPGPPGRGEKVVVRRLLSGSHFGGESKQKQDVRGLP